MGVWRMSLIIIPCWNTPENNRFSYSEHTVNSALSRLDDSKHQLIVVDNASTDPENEQWLNWVEKRAIVIRNTENKGTAYAVNQGIKLRKPGQHCCKLDSDIVVDWDNWADLLEEAIDRDETIGICGLKRVDLEEHPDHEWENYRSQLYSLPHVKGQTWITGEIVLNMMGSCTMFSSRLLDKIGYMHQIGLYGLDDFDISIRSRCAGFKNVFLPYVPIQHIDTGEREDYIKWKIDRANEAWPGMQEIGRGYLNGTIDIYYDGN